MWDRFSPCIWLISFVCVYYTVHQKQLNCIALPISWWEWQIFEVSRGQCSKGDIGSGYDSRMEKTQVSFGRCIGFLVLMQKKTTNKTMVLILRSTLGSRHHHWWTIGPLPYNLNSSSMKLSKTGLCWTSNDWLFEI